jgi:hypothetical protein
VIGSGTMQFFLLALPQKILGKTLTTQKVAKDKFRFYKKSLNQCSVKSVSDHTFIRNVLQTGEKELLLGIAMKNEK